VCSGQAGALPRLRGFCPEKRNLRSEFCLPVPRLPLTLAVGRFVAQGDRVFEKIDNFAMEWLETAKSGLVPISEAMQATAEFVFNLFWAIVALLIMVFTFPLWFLGKVRAQQSVQPTRLSGSQVDEIHDESAGG